MIVGGRLKKLESFGRQLIKKDEDMNGFYKSECKMTVILREYFTWNSVSVRERCKKITTVQGYIFLVSLINESIPKLSQKLSILGMMEGHKENLRPGPVAGGQHH